MNQISNRQRIIVLQLAPVWNATKHLNAKFEPNKMFNGVGWSALPDGPNCLNQITRYCLNIFQCQLARLATEFQIIKCLMHNRLHWQHMFTKCYLERPRKIQFKLNTNSTLLRKWNLRIMWSCLNWSAFVILRDDFNAELTNRQLKLNI